MEEDLKKLDDLFDSILDEIVHPEKAGTYLNPFIEPKTNRISELAEAVTVIMVNIAKDGLSATAVVMSNSPDHKPFTEQDIIKTANSSGVFYGIDEDSVKYMAEAQITNTEIPIAYGLRPVQGVDGKLDMKFDVTESNSIEDIEKDTEICHIVSPKAGRDGQDVRGHLLPATPGKPVEFPMGEGLYRKGNRIYARRKGKLIYRAGKYSVVDELVINKNVDQSSGIIGYSGTIVVNGNVTGRAVVRAGGGVVVHGIVSNAVIEAEGDVIIDGMINDASISVTNGSIFCVGMTDSTIVCGGSLKAVLIQNCTVKCVTGVSCLEGMGRIVGGEVYCTSNVDCLTIGSKEHTETRIIMGDYTEFSKELEIVEKKIKQIDSEIAKINDHVNSIREKEKAGTATLDDQSFLDAALRIRAEKTGERVPLVERSKWLNGIIELANKATLTAKTMIYGGAIIKIGGFSQILNSDRARAVARSNGKALVIT